MPTVILNFDRATHVSLIQNESYQQSPKKTENNADQESQLTLYSLEFIY